MSKECKKLPRSARGTSITQQKFGNSNLYYVSHYLHTCFYFTAISYALWELGFWGISIPVCSVTYYKVAGHWPDWSNAEDMEKLGAEAFAFVNFARLAVPLRIGLALSTTPWIDDNVVQKFMKKDGDNEGANDE